MIICSCNVVSDCDIRRTVDELKQKSPGLTITADLIFKSLGRQLKCGTCISGITKIIEKQNAELL